MQENLVETESFNEIRKILKLSKATKTGNNRRKLMQIDRTRKRPIITRKAEFNQKNEKKSSKIKKSPRDL